MSTIQSEKQILEKLAGYRKAGSLKDVPDILNILRENPEGEVSKVAILLLSDIKDDKMISILMDALHNPENETIRKHLVQACWESGLDYTDQLAYFVALFLVMDYLGAIEAFSLIENTLLDHDVSENIKNDMVTKIRAVILDLPEHKKNLGLELIHLLEGR